MKNVSESFREKIKQPSRRFSIRISIGGLDYDENNIETFKIISSIGNSDVISLGAFVADNLELSLVNTRQYNFTDNEPALVFAMLEGEPEICLGKFYIDSDSVEKTRMNTSVDAFGIASKLAETEYVTSLAFPVSLSAIVDELETRYNIEFINKDLVPNIQYKSKPIGTVRAMISEIAQMCGMNVRERFEKLDVHQLEFVFSTDTNEIFTADNYMSFKWLADTSVSVTKLIVEKTDTATVNGQEVGMDDIAYGTDDGYILKFNNDHIENASELEVLYEKNFPYNFVPFEVEMQGMPHIDAGDSFIFRELTREIRIAGVVENELTLHVISHVLEYNGGFKSTFKSECPSDKAIDVGSNGIRMEDVIKRTEKKISSLQVDNDRIVGVVAKLENDVTVAGTMIEQTSEQIQLTAERVDEVRSQFTQTADTINLRIEGTEQGISEIRQEIGQINIEVGAFDKVTGEDIISKINMTPETIKIESKNIDITGLVTFKDLKEENEETVINGGNITTGFVSADRIQGGQFKATTDSESFLEITENGIKIQGEPNETILDETNITELSARKFFEIDGRETGLSAWSGKWGIVLQGQAGTDSSSGGLALGSKDKYDMVKLYPTSYENEQRAGKMVVEAPAVFVNGAYETSFQEKNKYVTKDELEEFGSTQTDGENITTTELIKMIIDYEKEIKDGDTPATKSSVVSIFKDIILSYGKIKDFYLEDYLAIEGYTTTRLLDTGAIFPILAIHQYSTGTQYTLWLSGSHVLYEVGINGGYNKYRILNGVYATFKVNDGHGRIYMSSLKTGDSLIYAYSPRTTDGFYNINEEEARIAFKKAANFIRSQSPTVGYISKESLPSRNA